MNAIDDADLVTRINTVIVDLDTVDALRSSVRSRGGIASADEVQFQPGTHASLSALMSEGTMLVGRLAAMLGVDVRHNPFSTAAPSSGYMKQG